MARPKKEGEKKGNISVSMTETEKFSVQRRAGVLGFRSAANYLLALHEAEQRLGLMTKVDFHGWRWFVKDASDPIPIDTTLEDAIQALVDDRDDLGRPARTVRANWTIEHTSPPAIMNPKRRKGPNKGGKSA